MRPCTEQKKVDAVISASMICKIESIYPVVKATGFFIFSDEDAFYKIATYVKFTATFEKYLQNAYVTINEQVNAIDREG